jgi:hypothetical protein
MLANEELGQLNFALMWFCLGILLVRNNRSRTYQWTLLTELEMTALWILPVRHVLKSMFQAAAAGKPMSLGLAGALGVFGLNLYVFHIVLSHQSISFWNANNACAGSSAPSTSSATPRW